MDLSSLSEPDGDGPLGAEKQQREHAGRLDSDLRSTSPHEREEAYSIYDETLSIDSNESVLSSNISVRTSHPYAFAPPENLAGTALPDLACHTLGGLATSLHAGLAQLGVLRGKAVVVLGSFSSPLWRRVVSHGLAKLAAGERHAPLLLVYTQEAHTVESQLCGVPNPMENVVDCINYHSPRTLAERLTIAKRASAWLREANPLLAPRVSMLVDGIDDRVNTLCRTESCQVIVLQDGVVTWQSNRWLAQEALVEALVQGATADS